MFEVAHVILFIMTSIFWKLYYNKRKAFEKIDSSTRGAYSPGDKVFYIATTGIEKIICAGVIVHSYVKNYNKDLGYGEKIYYEFIQKPGQYFNESDIIDRINEKYGFKKGAEK